MRAKFELVILLPIVFMIDFEIDLEDCNLFPAVYFTFIIMVHKTTVIYEISLLI